MLNEYLMHEHTVATLTKTLSETIGEIEVLRERIEDRTVLVESTKRLIIHYDPSADLGSVRGVKARGKAKVARGAVGNAVVRVMKAGPLSTNAIVSRVIANVPGGSDNQKAWENRVKTWLSNAKVRKTVSVCFNEAGEKLWELTPFKPP